MSAVLTLAACQDATAPAQPPSEDVGAARLVVAVHQGVTASDVQRVDLTVDGPGQPELTVQLGQDGSVWTVLMSQLPAGTGRRFRAFAYDASARLLYRGEAADVTITANQTVQVNILLQQVDPPPDFENAGPVITSLVVSRSSVERGGFVDMRATAADPNPGDVLTYAWTATAGTFSTPSALSSRWTAPMVEGSQTVTLTVADPLGASTAVSFPILVEGEDTGGAVVSGQFNSWPQVVSLTGFPTQVVPHQSLGVSAQGLDSDDAAANLHYAWTASCAGTWTDEGTANARFTPTALPAQSTCANCQLTVRVTDGRGGEGLGHLGICVGAPVSPNALPRITDASQSTTTVGPGSTVHFSVRAMDPEGTALGFAWEAPVGTLGTPVSTADGSEVTWTAPACLDAQVTPVVRAWATDAEGLEALRSFSFTWTGPACATMVQGVVNNRYFTTGNASVTRGQDLSGVWVEAMVEQGDGTFLLHPGTGAADGTFTVAGVPQGDYTLRLGNTYVVTSSRAPNLGSDIQGRPDVVAANTSTFLSVDLQGLASWQGSDLMEIYSPGTALYAAGTNGLVQSGTPLAAGAQRWTQTLRYSGMENAVLVDASAGDPVTFHQLSAKTDSSYGAPITYNAATRAFTAPLVVTQGGTASFTGTMTALQDQSLTLDLRSPVFEALRTEVHPTATVVRHDLYFIAVPDGTRAGYALAPDLLTCSLPAGSPNRFYSFVYGNPYPSFTQAGMVQTNFNVALMAPGATQALTLRLSVGFNDVMPAFAVNAVAPRLSPPRGATLAGQAASGNLTGVGLMPRLSWGAPTVGTATHYGVYLYEVFVNAQGRTSQVAGGPVAKLYTAGTSLRLPPGILGSGKSYFAIIEARSSGNADFQGQPFRSTYPEAKAMTVTGVFTP
ncbi:hypothetical protein D7V80_00235 [Corallococcus sp. CA054B]|uniref:hypothetical protein n=1 Tax=Corallococcus sp. CA054B TaxID=2316734 RepID=UPI000EA13DE7|nr:hypothetical protein [Corallococcus sp. CA054B]RKG71766.1 hypothetical protein D7V80_00235 [Corallococcus sp. CA054B]